METRQLKNFGQLFTTRPSARVYMSFIAVLPSELGFISTPKFLAKYQRQDRLWKRRHFREAEVRGISHPQFIESIQSNVLAFYTTLIQMCDKDKALNVYARLSEKMGMLMYEEFFPKSKEFLEYGDPWKTFQEYMLGFLGTWQREGICRFQILSNADDELHVQLTDCALNAIYRESGYHEIAPVSCQANYLFLARQSNEIGGSFMRKSWICRGDSTCDWRFLKR